MTSPKPKAYVLDSWSILAYLEDEPAAAMVADLIVEAHERRIQLLMSVVNVGEVWYILARRTSDADADRSVTELHELGIEFRDADWRLVHGAARFKSKHKISFADGFAAALTSQEKDAVLLTGDQAFKSLEREIRVMWLPRA